MKTHEYYPERADFYKNNDFPGLEGNSAVDDTMVQQPRSEVEGHPPEKDPGAQEREQQLEAFMTDIKAFIRNIDVSKL